MEDTEEEQPFPATTPQDDQRCTRTTGCQKTECLVCHPPGTGTNHVRNLSQELGTTPTPKKTKPTAPADHIFSILTEEFEQAFMDNDTVEIEGILTQYDLFGKTCPDYLKYDRSALNKLVLTARELHKGRDNSQPATTPTPPTPQPQAVSMKLPRAEPFQMGRCSQNPGYAPDHAS